jgi:fucose permease
LSDEIAKQTVSVVDFSPGERTKRLNTVAYYAAFVALGLVGASLGPTLTGLAENTGTDLSQVSLLFTAVGLGYLIGAFLGGRLYDRASGHPVMAFMIVGISAMMLLVPLIPTIWLLAGVVLVLGMAEGAVDVGGNTLLVWVHRDKVGPFMNALHFFFGVGAFLSPIIIAQAVLIGGDILWAYWVLALMILPVAVWLMRLTSPVSVSHSEQTSQETRQHSTPNRDSHTGLLVVLFVVFFFVYAAVEIGYGGWIFTYGLESGLAGEASAAYLTSAFFGAFTFGRLLAVPIARRVRSRYMLLGDLAGAIASVTIILLWSDSLAAVWLGSIGLGLSLASIFPTMLTFAEGLLTITGRVTGLFFVGVSSGSMFWPWLIGQLFEPVGPQVMLFIVLLNILLAIVVFSLLTLYAERFVPAREEPSVPV